MANNICESEKISWRFRTVDIAYIALFVCLIAVCSGISIPLTVPITLQTFAVFLMLGLLGVRRSLIALCVYITLGCVGLPVFSNFTSGVGALVGSTGGYIMGFFATILVGGIVMKVFGKSTAVMAVAYALGLLACYAFGTVWFMNVYAKNVGAVGLMAALGWCVFPFIVPDLIKIVMAIFLTKKLKKFVKITQ